MGISRCFVRGALLTASISLLISCGGSGEGGFQSDPPAPVEFLMGDGIDPPENLLLQLMSPSSMMIRWKASELVEQVCIGNSNQEVLSCLTPAESAADYQEVVFESLEPGQVYYYSIGRAFEQIMHFRFPSQYAEDLIDGSFDVLVLGDSGTGRDEAIQLVQTAVSYYEDEERELDLIMLLGDSAYLDGTHDQWSEKFFEVYREMLFSFPVIATVGNHEMGSSKLATDPSEYTSADDMTPRIMPYLEIFDFPASGLLGGERSQSELYYSIKMGSANFISLDSQISVRDAEKRQEMLDWLESTLSLADTDWNIIFFHHPPFSKGKHDSDFAEATGGSGSDIPMWLMRSEFLPVFDQYPVDIVFSGHSHSYERSYYIGGFYGDSADFDDAYAELDGFDNILLGAVGQPYTRVSENTGLDNRAVYVVCGAAGRADEGDFDHAVHIEFAPDNTRGLAEEGFCDLSITENRVSQTFVSLDGVVRDAFFLERD